MNRLKTLLPVFVASLLLSSPLRAESAGFLGLSNGYFGPGKSEDKAIDFRVEYRPDSHVFLKNLKPWMGLQVTSDASLWAGGGLLYDQPISERWHIIPSFGIGYYAKGKSELDLGYPVEFRSQLELAYEFSSGHRAALALSHLSNAGLGSSRNDNPGTEVIGLYWHIPLEKILN